MASLNQLKRTSKRPYRRVGRGQSSTRGKTSGRGGKGQTARSGHKIRPALRDIIKKLPKRRGYGKNRSRTVNTRTPAATAVSINRLNQLFENGAEISPAVLKENGIISARGGNTVKIVGGTEAPKKFMIKQCRISGSARVAVEKAGGSVVA
ncbi:MAG TPA: 50S ribosomal protein L15 [Candidatus Paceibacterota bacterium]